MPRALIETFGGKAMAGGALAPRSRRGVVGSVDEVRRGGGLKYNIATGGNTLTNYTSGGVQYRSHVFTSGGTFSVTELGTDATFDILVVGGGGGGGGTFLGRGFADGSAGAGGFATTTMLLPVGNYQVTIGGAGSAGCYGGSAGGQSSFGAGTSLITANGGNGGGGCEYCCGGGGSGGSASVSGSLGTNNVTYTGYNGPGGCACGSGYQAGRDNTYQDGTTRKYASVRGSSEQGCACSGSGEVYGGGGQGGHTNCGCGGNGLGGVVIVRYKFVP